MGEPTEDYERAIKGAKKQPTLVTVTADLTFLLYADNPETALQWAVEGLHSHVGGASITEGSYSWELRSARVHIA